MSIWQTKVWGEMLIKSKQAEKIFEIDWVFVEKRKVSMWEYWLFVVGLKSFISKEINEKLIDLTKKEKALFLQIESINYKKEMFFDEKVFKRWKPWFYKKFITPYTAVIDLTKTEEDILREMKPKGRYNIRLAEKKGVVVKMVEKTDENIKQFYDLMMETTSRDSFSGNTFEFYKIFLDSLKDSKLILAYKNEKVIVAWIFVFHKNTAIYYYGASSSDKEYRNLMSPYLLQWKAIKYAKEKKCKIYDFLWVATPWDARSTLLWVTGFKMKLTKDIRWVSDSYIFINKKIKYSVISILRKLKK